MGEFTKSSNDYVEKSSLLEPNIQTWYRKHVSEPFYFTSCYHLLALILYMGVFLIPCKKEYWKYDNTWTYHPIIHEMEMSPWIIFHISSVDL